jgi:archaellum biogenesis ATPase FlaH
MNENIIRYTLELLKPNELIEIRIVGNKTYSGYFRDCEKLLPELKRFQNDNIYFVLNEINEACYSREQKDKIIERPKNTTSDHEITKRNWILIDVDSKRATGVSSTTEEKSKSKNVANKIYTYLRDIGFCEPICTDSGNGFHLLYKIDLPNDNDSKELLQKFLQVLDMYFTVDGAEVDKSVFNASRITKLYGTFARKGQSTEERPHRESKLLRVPEIIKTTPIELLKKVADNLPKKEAPKFQNNYGKDEFDLDNFIVKHNIPITSTQNYGDGIKYILDACFFDSNHKGKDACLFKTSSGAIGYKCFHNSCSEKKWQDVRILFEPTAYDKKQTNRITHKPELSPQTENTERGKKFLQLSEIESIDRSEIISIPSGFQMLDKKIIGFNKGEVTLWSGKNGSAKSTVINQIMLNGINKGFKFALYSGELTGFRVKNWITLQAAGRQFNAPTNWEGVYVTPKNISDKIAEWLNGKLWIYNNYYGNNFEQLLVEINELIEREGVDSIVLDNLMTLDILSLDGFQNEKQSTLIKRICTLAKEKNIHIHIIAHPRKAVGFLRKDDISGTSDLSNAVDNVIICHRNNVDFQKNVLDFFPKEMGTFLDEYTNYIEVCKNRDLGIVDYIVGLFFEVESKRLLNERHENVCYEWQDSNVLFKNTNFDEQKEEYPF